MTFKSIAEHRFFAPGLGATLSVACGLFLWSAPAGERLRNASYDDLFRFGFRPITNQLALVLMDNEAYAELGQSRTQEWSRLLHAQLLDKLAADNCALVVFDVFFRNRKNPAEDSKLAAAMRRQRAMVLGAREYEWGNDVVIGVETNLPIELFLAAASTNWGVAKADTNRLDSVVRRHWPAPPFPSPELPPSLPFTAARLAGANPGYPTTERWMRYYGYGRGAAWTYVSYGDALSSAPGFFRDKIVFVGNEPANRTPDGEPDEFCTPFTRWENQTAGGVEILATQFLNLTNADWLRRLPSWIEVLLLILTGSLLGAGLSLMRLWLAWVTGAVLFVALLLGAVCLSLYTNVWFPWLIMAGGQMPLALACASATGFAGFIRRTWLVPDTIVMEPEPPEPPDYQRFGPPFGEGGFGKVWIVRNAIGQWQALKEVYKDNFDGDAKKFDMEFQGIQQFKPISHEHPGLVRIEFVSREKRGGYFYYVMELGDPLDPDCDWKLNPTLYKPRDLAHVCTLTGENRLPVRDCAQIGFKLADALEFLHRKGLTHRDIKPRNVIFVNGEPKLADAGTVTIVRPPERISTRVVSRGFTPPGEPPGTRQADIYSLGKLLYVISTGGDPEDDFPSVSTTLLERSSSTDFMGLNRIISKACHPDLTQRYAAAEQMKVDLAELLRKAPCL